MREGTMKKEAKARKSEIKRFNGGAFFAGANSGHGFVSYYDSILKDGKIEKVYILKGGPGTGKSSFMKKAAEYALRRGMSVESYICSSDPDSLDGVVIDGRLAILDGTAPHSVEPQLAGVRDEIVNLGIFWDDIALGKRAPEIEELSKSKSDAYKKAYRYLSAYEKICELNSALTAPYFLDVKARRSIDRIFSKLSAGGGYRADSGIISSVGMKGSVRFDTYERFADKIFLIDDCLDCAHIYLRYVIEKARQTDTPIRVSYDPVCCDRPDAVFLYGGRVVFSVSESEIYRTETVRINMKRFLDANAAREVRAEFRLNKRLAESIMDSAKDALRAAGRYHFALEEIYSSSMDFEAQSVFVKNFLETVIFKK
jgi:hypothetical protein